jgi:hypothetical protein
LLQGRELQEARLAPFKQVAYTMLLVAYRLRKKNSLDFAPYKE